MLAELLLLRLETELKEPLWLAYRALNVVAVSPTQVSVSVPGVTVAW